MEKRGFVPNIPDMNKTLLAVIPAPPGHWVGDGFPVRSLFDYNRFGAQVSPFLLLDYAGPAVFAPAAHARGVGEHPHRGFETVTLVYQGAVAHRDSVGNSGVIGPGDVQWMTAARGIIHSEMPLPHGAAGVLSDGDTVRVQAGKAGTRFLLLAAKPLREPVVQYGPFVMNTHEEIEQALADYRDGRLAAA